MERRKFTREFKLEAVRLIKDRGVSYVQASEDLGVHTSQLRDWVKKFADDPQHAFPGNGQMKPEQLEIARLKREVNKLKAERERQGLSLKGLGVLSGLDRTFIGRIERGERSPTLLNCLRLADALKLRLGDVIDSAMRRES